MIIVLVAPFRGTVLHSPGPCSPRFGLRARQGHDGHGRDRVLPVTGLPRQHDTVGPIQNSVRDVGRLRVGGPILHALLVLDLGMDLDLPVHVAEGLADLVDVRGLADEGGGDVVHPLLDDPLSDVVDVLLVEEEFAEEELVVHYVLLPPRRDLL